MLKKRGVCQGGDRVYNFCDPYNSSIRLTLGSLAIRKLGEWDCQEGK